ncbi:hypothetical protein QYF36_016306 [Acer negundo]|nr:hypothetical protein QYF36_016306 [Acer negundo]
MKHSSSGSEAFGTKMSGFRGTLSIIPPPSNMNGTISEMHPPLGQQEISQIGEQNVDDEMVCLDFISLGKSSHFKQKKLRSEVWKLFEKYRDKNGKDRAKCNICRRDFDGSSKKGTTHLKNHLKICQKKQNGGGGGDKTTKFGNLTNPIAIKEKSVTDQQLNNLNIKHRNRRSDVWEKFEKYKDENGKDRAKCNLCEKVFDGSSKKGTTHLRNHFKICQKQINGVGDKPAKAADQLTWEEYTPSWNFFLSEEYTFRKKPASTPDLNTPHPR